MRRWARRRPRRAAALIAALLVVLIGAGILWLYAHGHETTDDAQIDGHIAAVSARVAGSVLVVHVEDNQPVEKGQLLVELDARDFLLAIERAEAELAAAEAQLQAATPAVPITSMANETRVSTAEDEVSNAQAGVAGARREHEAALAAVREAEAQRGRARADLTRYRFLLHERAVPRQRYDEALATAQTAEAAVDSARARARAAQKGVAQAEGRLQQAESRRAEAAHNAPGQLFVQRATIAQRQAQMRVAQAALARAKLDLQYTKVYAPFRGVVGKRAVEPGEHVAPGQELLAVVDAQHAWVTANFKETQLARIRPGQYARVHVDAIGRDFDGSVESVAAASGARYSLLPPENATGNYVKVVQRIPVRIRLDPGQPGLDQLRPGMSVEPKIRLR